MMRVGQHVAKHVGPIAQTLHHDVPHPLSVVLFHVPPHEGRPFHAVVTAGMSHHAMTPPRGAEGCTHVELVALLPPEWDLSPEGLRKLQNAWPLRELESLARMPYDHGDWLWCGHSMANGHPAMPYGPGTNFAGALLVHPERLLPGLGDLKLDDRLIHFLAFLPVYRDELHWILRRGKAPFYRRMDAAGFTEIIDTSRPSVLARPPRPSA
jgi:hypothetical protein